MVKKCKASKYCSMVAKNLLFYVSLQHHSFYFGYIPSVYCRQSYTIHKLSLLHFLTVLLLLRWISQCFLFSIPSRASCKTDRKLSQHLVPYALKCELIPINGSHRQKKPTKPVYLQQTEMPCDALKQTK